MKTTNSKASCTTNSKGGYHGPMVFPLPQKSIFSYLHNEFGLME